MKTKICTKCKIEKDESEFYWKIKNVKKMSSCKSCRSFYSKSHYHKNKIKYKVKARTNKDNQVEKIAELVANYLKENPCVDCGEENIIVLQFDHIKGVKKKGIGRMVQEGYSWKTIQKEISKCEIRCVNCHIKRHAKESESFRYLITKQ